MQQHVQARMMGNAQYKMSEGCPEVFILSKTLHWSISQSKLHRELQRQHVLLESLSSNSLHDSSRYRRHPKLKPHGD